MSACAQAQKKLNEAEVKRRRTASSDTGGGAASSDTVGGAASGLLLLLLPATLPDAPPLDRCGQGPYGNMAYPKQIRFLVTNDFSGIPLEAFNT